MSRFLDRIVYQPSHGPKVWPWWKLLTVHVARCTHDPGDYFWITPISYNLWLYTRWGALCFNIKHRAGVYRREEIDRRGWWDLSKSAEIDACCCGPWKCFFCGEVFPDAVTAGRHFGEHEGCEYPVPGCVDPLRRDEKARLHAVQLANYEAQKACDERDSAQEDADAYRAQPAEIERLFGKGVRTLHQAYLVLDTMEGRALAAEQERDRLHALIARPYVGAWLDEILIEAAHQRDRWGADQDHGKTPGDWFWLVGYLGGKALAAHLAGDASKAHHHTVSTAAVLAHWASAISGAENVMRPGVGAAKIAGVE